MDKRQISVAFNWSSSLLDICLINFTVEMGSLAVIIALVSLKILVLSPTTLLYMTESVDFLKTAGHNKVSSLTFFRPKLKYILKGVIFYIYSCKMVLSSYLQHHSSWISRADVKWNIDQEELVPLGTREQVGDYSTGFNYILKKSGRLSSLFCLFF